MTLCNNCGSPVTPGDAFCGVCGAYLDWSTAKPSTPAPSTPVDPVPVSGAPAVPVSGAPAVPVSGVPGVLVSGAPGVPVSGAPVSGAPVSGAPVSGAPVSGAPVSDADPSPPRKEPQPVIAPAPAGSRADAPTPTRDEPLPDARTPERNEPKSDARMPKQDEQRSDAPTSAPDAPGADASTPAHDEPGAEAVAPASSEPEAPPAIPDRRNRAAALIVPVSESHVRATVRTESDAPEKTSGTEQPAAVQPGKPVAPRPVLREFTGAEDGGQVICPVCGTANPAGQSFCRRCGSSLVAAAAPERSKRSFRIRWPRRWSWVRRLIAMLLIMALAVLAAWAAVTWGSRAVDAVRDRLAKPALTTPSRASASSSEKGHGPDLISDGLNNRYWSPAAGKGAGQWVELGFDQPIRILNIIVSGGVSPEQDGYLKRGRPAKVQVSTWTSKGVRTDRELELADRAGPQTFAFTAGDTSRLRVTIESGYALGKARAPAIAEIEVFRRP
jgi:ribosomal protein L40E